MRNNIGNGEIRIGFATLDDFELERIYSIVFFDDFFLQLDDVQLKSLYLGGKILFVGLLILEFLHEFVDQFFQLGLYILTEIPRLETVIFIDVTTALAKLAHLAGGGDL